MQPQQLFSPVAFFGHGSGCGKSGNRAGSAKRASNPQVASPTQSDDSVQVVSPQPLRFDSPSAIPLMEFQNQPGHIGSKPNSEKPMGKFLPSPGQSLFSKGRQQEFQQMCDQQQMASTTLERWTSP